MVAVGQEIWAMGGWDNNIFQDAVEVFDVRADKWRDGPKMKTPHAYFMAAHLNGEIFAAGGMLDRSVFSHANDARSRFLMWSIIALNLLHKCESIHLLSFCHRMSPRKSALL